VDILDQKVKLTAFVTKNLTSGEMRRPPFNAYNWPKSYCDEVTNICVTHKVLDLDTFVLTWAELPDNATVAEIIPVHAVKNFDMLFAQHKARIRIVYNGKYIRDKYGKVVSESSDLEKQLVPRHATTSPLEVRMALTWGMVADPKGALQEKIRQGCRLPKKGEVRDSEYVDVDTLLESCDAMCFDVTAAYLQAPLPEEFEYYVTSKNEMLLDAIAEATGKRLPPGALIKMVRALYGHPLAGDVWANECSKMLSLIAFEYVDHDEDRTIYVKKFGGEIVALLVLYVDDGVLISFDKATTESVHDLLVTQWSARDWEPFASMTVQSHDSDEPSKGKTVESTTPDSIAPSRFLAAEIWLAKVKKMLIDSVVRHESRVLFLMESYVYHGVQRYVDAGGELMTTAPKSPMTSQAFDDRDEWDGAKDVMPPGADQKNCAMHIGTWMYPAGNSRPDIAYPINWLSKRCHKWSPEAGRRLKRLISWAKVHAGDTMVGYGIRGDRVQLWVLVDSDYAEDSSRKSNSSWLIKLIGPDGTSVVLDWKTQQQKSISLSTAEAELVAFRDALKKVMEILPLLEALFGCLIVKFFSDSSAALGIVKKGASKALRFARKVHDVSAQWIKDVVDRFGIVAEKVSSSDNSADVGTKVLGEKCRAHHIRYGQQMVPKDEARLPRCKGRCYSPHAGETFRCLQHTKGGDLCDDCKDPSTTCLCQGGRPSLKCDRTEYIDEQFRKPVKKKTAKLSRRHLADGPVSADTTPAPIAAEPESEEGHGGSGELFGSEYSSDEAGDGPQERIIPSSVFRSILEYAQVYTQRDQIRELSQRFRRADDEHWRRYRARVEREDRAAADGEDRAFDAGGFEPPIIHHRRWNDPTEAAQPARRFVTVRHESVSSDSSAQNASLGDSECSVTSQPTGSTMLVRPQITASMFTIILAYAQVYTPADQVRVLALRFHKMMSTYFGRRWMFDKRVSEAYSRREASMTRYYRTLEWKRIRGWGSDIELVFEPEHCRVPWTDDMIDCEIPYGLCFRPLTAKYWRRKYAHYEKWSGHIRDLRLKRVRERGKAEYAPVHTTDNVADALARG
ncbi:MAG: hypothetical protein HOH43_15840, partial [Candidatus Latescibacteria bacterium]|nr:hypothetical protein [Candidatus Latescibacterota bacterium]